jgi:hypothetical protein
MSDSSIDEDLFGNGQEEVKVQLVKIPDYVATSEFK